MNMSGQQQKQYSKLSVAFQRNSNDRSFHEKNASNFRPLTYQPKTIYYNSNRRYQQQQQEYLSQTSTRRQKHSFYPNSDRINYHYQHQSIRPLMEIKDNLFLLHHHQQKSTNTNDSNNDDDEGDDDDKESISSLISKLKQPKQRGQYRNRKAELDWDHAFDLDLIDLYPTQPDLDRYSLTSTLSSSDHSFSSM